LKINGQKVFVFQSLAGLTKRFFKTLNFEQPVKMNLGFGGFDWQPVCLFPFVSTDCDAKMEHYFLISIAPLKKVLKNTRF